MVESARKQAWIPLNWIKSTCFWFSLKTGLDVGRDI